MHGRLSSWCSRVAEGTSGGNALGFRRPVAPGRRQSRKARVVRDGNFFTSGGVTSGIDFAFRIVAELAGPEVAQAIQLMIEYDPSPPFDAGHPDKASEAAMALGIQRTEVAHTGIQQGLEKLAAVGKV